MADQELPISTSEPASTVTPIPTSEPISMLEPVKNIVIVGKTGNGKSATGNTLLGSRQFVCKKQAGGVTMKSKMLRAATQDGPVINVIDTPGLFDLGVSADYISKEIISCLNMAEEGIHAVLFVLSTKNRVTPEEEATLHILQNIFESKILDYIIVVFTGGDELEDEGQTLDDYLSEGCPDFLKRVLRLCGQRKVLFDNKTKDEVKKAEQIKQLMAHVANVERQTSGKPYTDNMHRKIKEENDKVREQEREIESKNLAEAETKVMQEQLRVEHEKNMKMMAEAVENALKQNAAVHEKEMRLLEDTRKQNAGAHEREMRQMEDALKQNAIAHERDIRHMKDEFKHAQQRQEDAAAHDKVLCQMKEEFQRQQAQQLQTFQQQQQAQQLSKPPPLECNIM